jgi:hypothetical protein
MVASFVNAYWRTWNVLFEETTPTSINWGVTAQAICADAD